MKEILYCDRCTDRGHCPEYTPGGICPMHPHDVNRGETDPVLKINGQDLTGYFKSEKE